MDNDLLLDNEEEGQETPADIIIISDNSRSIIFICLILISLFSACDGGIIPQQTESLKKDFGENDKNSIVGLFSSVDYLGRVVGGFIFAMILGKINRKMLFVFTLLFKAVTLLIALLTKDKIINIIARGFSGISQVFYTTYFPVWCDQYGEKKRRTLMVTLVQLGAPIGIIIGYGLGLFCDKTIADDKYSGWRLSFAIEGIILIIFAFIIFAFQNKYFSCKFVLTGYNEGREEEKIDIKNGNGILSNFGKILCNKLFLFTTLSNSVAFFGMSVIQYWGDNYMKKVLNMGDKERLVSVGILCLLGPLLGMMFGGIVSTNLGGYGKKQSMVFIIILIFISSIVSEFTALIQNYIAFVILGFFFLFLICATIPPESGIIISSLENNLRGDGFALCNCLLNLIGNFPASYAYSILSDLLKDKFKKDEKESLIYALVISMGYNFIGFIFIVIAGIFRFMIRGDLSKDEINIDRTTLDKLTDSESIESNKK